ncbi:MAG: hypothetical protein ACFFD2_28860 [Promethearchaeota archaeon]
MVKIEDGSGQPLSNKKLGLLRDVQICILNKLRESSIKFAEFIRKNVIIPKILAINFPQATVKLIEEYGLGILTNQEFWGSWKEFFNLEEYFINALRYRFDPIIQLIPFMIEKNPKIQIIPYIDDHYFQMTEKLKERFFILTYRTKSTGKINLEAWKELLLEDFEWNKSYKESLDKNLLKCLRNKTQFVILYQGYSKYLRISLNKRGINPKIRHFGSYWRAPLEVLSYLISLKGINNIPNHCIQQCIKEHIAYVNIILSEPSLDAAHKHWTHKTFKAFSI